MKIGAFTENLLIAFVITLYDGAIAVIIESDGRPRAGAFQLDEIIDVRGVGDLGHPIDVLSGVFLFQDVDEIKGQQLFGIIPERAREPTLAVIIYPGQDGLYGKADCIAVGILIPMDVLRVGEMLLERLL